MLPDHVPGLQTPSTQGYPFHLTVFVPRRNTRRQPTHPFPLFYSTICFCHFHRVLFLPHLPPALGVATFPGLRCYQVVASVRPSPVRLQPRLKPDHHGETGPCGYLYWWMLAMLLFYVSVYTSHWEIFVFNCILCACKTDARPAPPHPFVGQVTFSLRRHGVQDARGRGGGHGSKRQCWSVQKSHKWFLMLLLLLFSVCVGQNCIGHQTFESCRGKKKS